MRGGHPRWSRPPPVPPTPPVPHRPLPRPSGKGDHRGVSPPARSPAPPSPVPGAAAIARSSSSSAVAAGRIPVPVPPAGPAGPQERAVSRRGRI